MYHNRCVHVATCRWHGFGWVTSWRWGRRLSWRSRWRWGRRLSWRSRWRCTRRCTWISSWAARRWGCWAFAGGRSWVIRRGITWRRSWRSSRTSTWRRAWLSTFNTRWLARNLNTISTEGSACFTQIFHITGFAFCCDKVGSHVHNNSCGRHSVNTLRLNAHIKSYVSVHITAWLKVKILIFNCNTNLISPLWTNSKINILAILAVDHDCISRECNQICRLPVSHAHLSNHLRICVHVATGRGHRFTWRCSWWGRWRRRGGHGGGAIEVWNARNDKLIRACSHAIKGVTGIRNDLWNMLNIAWVYCHAHFSESVGTESFNSWCHNKFFHVVETVTSQSSVGINKLHRHHRYIFWPCVGNNKFNRVLLHLSCFCHNGSFVVDTFTFMTYICEVDRRFGEAVRSRRFTNWNARKGEIVADKIVINNNASFAFGKVEIFRGADVSVNAHFCISMMALSCQILRFAKRDHQTIIHSFHRTNVFTVDRPVVNCYHWKTIFVPNLWDAEVDLIDVLSGNGHDGIVVREVD